MHCATFVKTSAGAARASTGDYRADTGKPRPGGRDGTLTIQMHSVSSRLGGGYPHPSGHTASNGRAPSCRVIRQSTG
ncbi:hypothetical protein BCEP27_60054 [Burkholderia cepacia]